MLKGVVGATLRCQPTDRGEECGVLVTVTKFDAGDVEFHAKVDERPQPNS
ncbi:hypothetical protein [Mycobacterium sp.]|jgi:hypothetical protein|nr:hypothetical protein [Mycobacterium sp.]